MRLRNVEESVSVLGGFSDDVQAGSKGEGSTGAEPGRDEAEGDCDAGGRKRPESDGEPRGTRRGGAAAFTQPSGEPASLHCLASIAAATHHLAHSPRPPSPLPAPPLSLRLLARPSNPPSHLVPFFPAPQPPASRTLRQPGTHISRHRSYVVMSAPCLRSRQTGSINIGAATRAAHLTICTCGRECKYRKRSLFPSPFSVSFPVVFPALPFPGRGNKCYETLVTRRLYRAGK